MKKRKVNKYWDGGVIPGGMMQGATVTSIPSPSFENVKPEPIKVEGFTPDTYNTKKALGINTEKVSGIIGTAGDMLSELVPQNVFYNSENRDNLINSISNNNSITSTSNALNSWSSLQHLGNVSWKDVANQNGGMNTGGNFIKGITSGASAGMAFGPVGGVIGGVLRGAFKGIGNLIKRRKFKKAANRQNRLNEEANVLAQNNALNNMSNIIDQNNSNILANYSAYGGPINMEYTGVMSPFGNRFDIGGNLTNGVIKVDNGGTHEENPYEGVQMGVDNQGIPNLVEEGEVIWNDYVFSNRLTPTKEMKKQNRYKGKTFAEVAKNLQKESEERPNDPISKNGLLASMSRLQQAQEIIRQQNQNSQEGVQYAHGGKMGTLFDGFGDKSNFLQLYTPEEKWVRTLQNNGIIPTYSLSKPQKYQNYSDIINSKERLAFETPSLLNTKTSSEKWVEDNVKPVQSILPIIDNYKIKNKKDNDVSFLRYAPVAGALIGLGQNLINRPDYSRAEEILESANNLTEGTQIDYKPISNYLTYNPFNIDYHTNSLKSQASASRRAAMNSINPAKYSTLVALDNNAQSKLAELERQAEEYNLAQRQTVENFNRGTNQTNAEMGLKAAMANQNALLQAKNQRLSGITQAMAMQEGIDSNKGASITANVSDLFNSLGNIGIDAMNRADRDMLIRAGVYGTIREKPKGWSDKEWEVYKKNILRIGFSNGGKLKNKRRGGFTY